MCIHYRCYKYIILALDCLHPLHSYNWYSVNEDILTNQNEQNVKYFYVINLNLVYYIVLWWLHVSENPSCVFYL